MYWNLYLMFIHFGTNHLVIQESKTTRHWLNRRWPLRFLMVQHVELANSSYDGIEAMLPLVILRLIQIFRIGFGLSFFLLFPWLGLLQGVNSTNFRFYLFKISKMVFLFSFCFFFIFSFYLCLGHWLLFHTRVEHFLFENAKILKLVRYTYIGSQMCSTIRRSRLCHAAAGIRIRGKLVRTARNALNSLVALNDNCLFFHRWPVRISLIGALGFSSFLRVIIYRIVLLAILRMLWCIIDSNRCFFLLCQHGIWLFEWLFHCFLDSWFLLLCSFMTTSNIINGFQW